MPKSLTAPHTRTQQRGVTYQTPPKTQGSALISSESESRLAERVAGHSPTGASRAKLYS
jgi:hypothetical protein